MYLENKVTASETALETCVWKGCIRKIPGTDILPFGWKYIAVTKGSLFIEDNLLGAEVDGVLCPEHSAQLRKLLKINDRKQ